MESQKVKIFKYMAAGKPINKLDAFKLFGCMTLAQRIADIKDDIRNNRISGYELRSINIKQHNNAEEYWLVKVNPQMELF